MIVVLMQSNAKCGFYVDTLKYEDDDMLTPLIKTRSQLGIAQHYSLMLRLTS